MVVGEVRKDGGTKKSNVSVCNLESKTHKARAGRSHTGHRDKLKQSTADAYR